MTEVQIRAKWTLEILREAVAEELDRKVRLGHYAVIYRDGEVVKIGPEEIRELLRQQEEDRSKSP